MIQFFFEEFACIALRTGGYFFRSAAAYDVASFFSSFRSHIDYVVGAFYHIHIMFYDD